MVRYFYSWTPLVIVGTVVFLSLPWLGLIALLVAVLVALAALAALAWAIVAAPLALVRATGHRWQGRSRTHRPTAAVSLTQGEHAAVTVEKRRSQGMQ